VDVVMHRAQLSKIANADAATNPVVRYGGREAGKKTCPHPPEDFSLLNKNHILRRDTDVEPKNKSDYLFFFHSRACVCGNGGGV
jgi:hypothetical protein